MKYDGLLQLNPRGSFVVVTTDEDSNSLKSEALKIYEITWMEDKVVRAVFLMPDSSGNYTCWTCTLGSHTKIKMCKKVQELLCSINGFL